MIAAIMLHSDALEAETKVGRSVGSWSLEGHADTT